MRGPTRTRLRYTFASMQGLTTTRATGIARMTGDWIMLDGHVAAPESLKGEPFITRLWPRGAALCGATDVLYRGGKIGAQIELARVS